MKQAICLIVNKPNEIYLDFLNKFVNYHIIVIIDDNSIYYEDILKKRHNNIIFFQLNNALSYNKGYINSNTMGIKKLISGWDKALFYFTHYDESYDYVWFIEDDVFFYDETTIITLDEKYKSYDLLSNCDFKEGKYDDWLWDRIKIKVPRPHFCGMMCAIRVSNKLLQCIKDYVCKYKKLFFIEALFPTITKYNNLTFYQPDELTKVRFRFDWKMEHINETNIYHPIKNMRKHIIFRNALKPQT
jgi:hypothetical protein